MVLRVRLGQSCVEMQYGTILGNYKKPKRPEPIPLVQCDIILTHNCSLVRNRKMVNLYPAQSGTLETSAWDLASHADFLRGSSRIPAPRSLGRIA